MLCVDQPKSDMCVGMLLLNMFLARINVEDLRPRYASCGHNVGVAPVQYRNLR